MRRKRPGLTLMELVVVIAILAVLAGLIVTRIDWARRQADMAASADTSGEVARNVQLYLTTKGQLPNGLDSLLEGSGGTAKYTKLFDSPPSLVSQSTLGALTASQNSSLRRIGLTIVHDHDTAVTYATNSGTLPRTLATGGNVLFVTTGSAIWNSIYPQGVYGSTYASATEMTLASGVSVSLIMLGVGPNNAMIGQTMVSPPQYPGPDPDARYYRYVVLVSVYSDGRRAQVRSAVDSFGRTINQALEQFHQAEPE